MRFRDLLVRKRRVSGLGWSGPTYEDSSLAELSAIGSVCIAVTRARRLLVAIGIEGNMYAPVAQLARLNEDMSSKIEEKTQDCRGGLYAVS